MAVAITQEIQKDHWLLPTVWHRVAPHRVVKKYRQGDLEGGWAAWQNHLRRRATPAAVPFLAGSSPPLLWYWLDAGKRSEIAAAMQHPVDMVDAQLGEEHA